MQLLAHRNLDSPEGLLGLCSVITRDFVNMDRLSRMLQAAHTMGGMTHGPPGQVSIDVLQRGKARGKLPNCRPRSSVWATVC